MSVKLIRFRNGMMGLYGVRSRYLGDVAAAHHVKARAKVRYLAMVGHLAAQAETTSVNRSKAGLSKHIHVSLSTDHGATDSYIWLTSQYRISTKKKSKDKADRKHLALMPLLEYEYGYTIPGKGKYWRGVGALQAAISAIYSAGEM